MSLFASVIVRPKLMFARGFPVFLNEQQSNCVPTEFELNRGQLVDSLRKDYTHLFEAPDLTLFDDSIELHVPDRQLALVGIVQYAAALDLLRLSCLAAKDNMDSTYRITLDDSSVRVRWSMKLWVSHPFSRLLSFSDWSTVMYTDPDWSTVMYADIVSCYYLDDMAHVYLHKLESTITLSAPNKQEDTPLCLA